MTVSVKFTELRSSLDYHQLLVLTEQDACVSTVQVFFSD